MFFNIEVTESDLDPNVQKMSINILMTAWKTSWARDLVAEMLPILKKNNFRSDYSRPWLRYDRPKKVPRVYMGSICAWNLFQPLAGRLINIQCDSIMVDFKRNKHTTPPYEDNMQ